MAAPSSLTVSPAQVLSLGSTRVRVSGTGIGAGVEVSVGSVLVPVIGTVPGAGFADVLITGIEPGTHDVTVQNLDEDGVVIAGEATTVPAALTVRRPTIASKDADGNGTESDLARVTRTVLRELKRQVIENVSPGVSVDYDESAGDGSGTVMLAQLPGLVLSGPNIVENRLYSTNHSFDATISETERERYGAAFTADLQFTLTGGSVRQVELLNMISVVMSFLNRTRWLVVPRDPSNPGAGSVTYEMDPQGELRMAQRGPGVRDDVRVFTTTFVVRGVDIDESAGVLRTYRVEEFELEVGAIQ